MNSLFLLGAATTWLKPLWAVGLGAIVAVLLLLGVMALLRLVVPRVAAIAQTTAPAMIDAITPVSSRPVV